MSDLGRNEIADLKHEKPPAGSHFRPRALRALGRKWKPLGGFSCLRSAIPFLPSSLMQKLPISMYCRKYSGRFFAFFKFREMQDLNLNILHEICKIAKSKYPVKHHISLSTCFFLII